MTLPRHLPPPPTLPPRPPPSPCSGEAPLPNSVMAMSTQDPRSSSTQSLVPNPASDDFGRRRLLLVYIHGFMGNETSFRSFPAHVHNLVTLTLADSHVVHTKIYPRYKSRDTLEVARDNFSAWLAPHEDQWTDVILLGHSMGGLLAADIVLAFRHRIIGIVNFDVPFLGMHPGIVKAGLGSIFNPPSTPQDAIIPDPVSSKTPSRMASLFNPKPTDPNYNPSFANDVQLPVRKGWENTLHWLSKHYNDGLRQATKGLVKSHFEFGSAMADYRQLKDRYARVRALEEDDETKRTSAMTDPRSLPRIRFVNYYTATKGRPKRPKSPKSTSPSRPVDRQLSQGDSDVHASPTIDTHASRDRQSHDDGSRTSRESPEPDMTYVHPTPISDSPRISMENQEDRGNEIVPNSRQESLSASSTTGASGSPLSAPDLPEIPPIPQEPLFIDLMQFSDRAERKAAEKEHEKALKGYQKAVKARNKTINERDKLEEKWEKQQEKLSAEEKQRQVEVGQRQAEARQRQAEVDQRQKEADMRQGHTFKQIPEPLEQRNSPKVTSPLGLEEDVGAMQLGSSSLPRQQSDNPYTNYDFSRSVIMSQASPDYQASVAESGYPLSMTDTQSSHQTPHVAENETPTKSKKLKKFCMLPPKDAQGNKDPTWIRVLMDGMDEVTAHTSLFFVNETYERLVGDVGAKIEDWVREADSVRLVREMAGCDLG